MVIGQNGAVIPNDNNTVLGRANLLLAQRGGAFVERGLQTTANRFAYQPAQAVNSVLGAVDHFIKYEQKVIDPQMLMALQPELSVMRIPTAFETFTVTQQFIGPSKNSIVLAGLLNTVGDETILGRLPNIRTAESPVVPTVFAQPVDFKPVATGGPLPK